MALGAFGGGRIVFSSSRDGHNQIYAMEADGSNQVNLSANQHDEIAPAIAPDGRITFVSDRDGNREIYIMDADGGNHKRLTNTAGDEFFMDRSPDGTRLVFEYYDADAVEWQLLTMKADGSERQLLIKDSEPLYHPDWSPDGQTIAFFLTGFNPGIYTLPAAGGSQFDDLKKIYTDYHSDHPRWSPDGSRLAFVRSWGGRSWIMTISADGTGEPVRISPGASYQWDLFSRFGGDNDPRWSPDGKRILYTSTYHGDYEQLYVAMADGSSSGVHVGLSATSATDRMADWGADDFERVRHFGQFVVYQKGGIAGPASIHLYDEEGRQTRLLLEAPSLRLAGVWGPWVVYQQGNAFGAYRHLGS